MRDNLSYYEADAPTKPIALLTIPFELGSDARGLASGPQYIIDAGLERMFDVTGLRVGSRAAIPCTPVPKTTGFPKFIAETSAVARASYETVLRMRERGERVVALCGDHASAIGTIAGAAAGERIGLIYIDAHPDIHTHESTISGNTHAMVVSSALGQGHPALVQVGAKRERVLPEDIIYVGIKDFDAIELPLIRKSGVRAFTMLDIALGGFAPVLAAIQELSERVDSVWVSMDIDSIDQHYAPGVAMPCTDGFTRREILALAHHIGKSCTLAGLDIVEIKPENDRDQITAALAIEIIARFLGVEYTWYRGYMQPYEIAQAIKPVRARGAKRKRPRASEASPR